MSARIVPNLASADPARDPARAVSAFIPYGPMEEPRGVRRFFLTDPDGHVVNVLAHSA